MFQEVTQDELNALLSSHELWLDSNGASGLPADFSGMLLRDVKFDGANLTGALFNNAHLRRVEFYECDLTDVNFSDAIMFRCKLWVCDTTRMLLANAHVHGTEFFWNNVHDAYTEGIYAVDNVVIPL